MDFLPYHTSSTPFPPPPPSSPSSQPSSRQPPSSSSPSSTTSSGWARGRAMASELLGKICSAIVACIFAVVGSLVGAVTGALIGLATESGLFRGAGIGAISGAVFSIEAVESSLAMWRSDGPGIWSVLFVIDIFLSLFSGRLVREKVGPAMQSAVQSQMNAIDRPFQEVLDIFETGGTRGMSQDSIDRLPKISITDDNSIDCSGSRACCSVCLQDFQVGERVRSLPHCQHMFHLQCIDLWLLKHGSCPLCRRDF